MSIPRTGRTGTASTLVTKTLVVAGEKGTFTLPDGRVGAMLRAYDKGSGREMGAVYMPQQQTGGPMTYMLNGVQYIVVAVGGPAGAEFIAYRLPAAEIPK
jgi:quinoprotein glucose dehydrogenase